MTVQRAGEIVTDEQLADAADAVERHRGRLVAARKVYNQRVGTWRQQVRERQRRNARQAREKERSQ
jgi:hypothetical protein